MRHVTTLEGCRSRTLPAPLGVMLPLFIVAALLPFVVPSVTNCIEGHSEKSMGVPDCAAEWLTVILAVPPVEIDAVD